MPIKSLVTKSSSTTAIALTTELSLIRNRQFAPIAGIEIASA